MFNLDDQRHLEAAEGWLQLGLPVDALAELEKITPELQGHPDVLELRWHISAKEKNWAACVDLAEAIIKLAPDRADGWIHRAFALHELKRTQEALHQLLPAVGLFPKVWTIPYNLACYASVLRQFDKAQQWLNQAWALDPEPVQQAAQADEDLQPLWDSRGGGMWPHK